MTVVESSGFSAESLRELEVVFSAVAGWATRIKVAPPPPEAGSALAADDAALAGFEVSHAVQGVLLSAVDHGDALRALVVDAKMVHSRAPFTLLRAALENAATAVWLLAPDVQSERLRRRLRLQWSDALDQVNVKNLQGMAAGMTKDEWKTEIRQAAVDAGLDATQVVQVVDGKVTFRSVAETAGDESATNLTGKHALLCWMISSGIAHAQSWAVLSILKRVETPSASPDVPEHRHNVVDGLAALNHPTWRYRPRRRTPRRAWRASRSASVSEPGRCPSIGCDLPLTRRTVLKLAAVSR